MNNNFQHTLRKKSTSLTTLCALSLVGALSGIAPLAHSQGFGTVTPGGVQPNLDQRLPPKATEKPEYDIPSVPERPLGEDEGFKVVVKHFQLEGVEEVPGTGIDQRKINLMLEEIRSSQPEGFTIGQLQAVARRVTQYYRQNGLILALAFVPKQQIRDGVVTISVLPGKLGQLSTANNTHYSEELMKRPFRNLVGETVQASQIEEALLRADDIPGLDIAGIFRPGKNVGDTELVLNAVKETPFQFNLYADNYGVESTGKQRLIAGMTWNNPLGFGDKLTIKGLQTYSPHESTYGVIDYQTQLFSPDVVGGITYSKNAYTVPHSLGFPGVDGTTRIASIYGKYLHTRSRRLNITGVLDFSTKHADLDLLQDFPGISFGEDNLTVVAAGVEINSVDRLLGGGVNEMAFYYHQGLADFLGSMDKHGDNNSLNNGSGRLVGGNFQKETFKLNRLQLINQTNTLLLRLNGQYSDDRLSSLEQFSMGGPNSVRAYPVSEYIRDKGVFASAEWRIDAPGFSDKPAFNGRTWGEVLSFSIFADYAWGRSNDPLLFGQNREQDISGVGIGMEFKPANGTYIKIEGATPTSSEDASNNKDPQLWLSAGLEF